MHHRKAMMLGVESETAALLETVFSDLDADLYTNDRLLAPDLVRAGQGNPDLIILGIRTGDRDAALTLEEVVSQSDQIALLVVLDARDLDQYKPPVRLSTDFACYGASPEEYRARICNLLWPGESSDAHDVIHVDRMVVDLATYQVKIDGKPIDLTYLEYALLTFLITQPGHTFSRDVLLKKVWGFDYYGGSRTVDVHVRRLRSKLGPDYAQHLQTIRGVGYLWNAD